MLTAQSTPLPVPTTVDNGLVFGQSMESWIILLFAIIAVLLISVVLTKALLSAGRMPPPTALVTALSVLTLFAMAGGLIGRGNEAWTIAAAGVGALAGSVTAVYTTDRRGNIQQLPVVAPAPVVEPPVAVDEAGDPRWDDQP